jgi:hydroxymethylpyrimidine/phosphomethylpyrimidine kinase
MSPYISKLKVHGSGCAFSSLLIGNIALGIKPLAAIKKAKQDVWNLYSTPSHLGKKASVLKYPPELDLSMVHSTDHIANALDLLINIKKIMKILPLNFVPEVGINICYAMPNAQSTNDICGIDGRIIAVQQGIRKCGKLSYGSSHHIAKIILTAMKNNPLYRAAMNIAYTTDIIEACQEKGLLITSFSRNQEPKNPHSSMEWGTNYAIQKHGEIPDIIYDTGGQGKEAMIRILGEKPKDLLKKVQKITI